MSQPRKRYARSTGTRSYRKLVLIATEGRQTEPQYFGLFKPDTATVRISCFYSNKGSAPRHVLSCLQQKVKEIDFRKGDEAWLVVDTDNWSEPSLLELHRWSETKPSYGLAVSNPKFEWWLLLHYEDGNGVNTSRECDRRLRRYINDYDKRIPSSILTPELLQNAIRRAKDRDRPPCPDWPHEKGTTVYRLVEHILGS